MRIAPDPQVPFEPSYYNIHLKLYPINRLRFWRRIRGAPSPVLSRGNRREVGIRAIEATVRIKIHGDREMMRRMDDLLQGFVAQQLREIAVFRLHPLLRDPRLALMPGCRQQPGALLPFLSLCGMAITYAFIFMMIIRGIARIVL